MQVDRARVVRTWLMPAIWSPEDISTFSTWTPQYNERCYAGYYHLPETIAQGLAPRVSGKAGIPCGPRVQSAFNRPANAFDALEDLLDVASFRLLVFHYSDDGLITRSALLGLFRRYGAVHDVTVDAHGYTTRSKNRTVQQRLYLISHD